MPIREGENMELMKEKRKQENKIESYVNLSSSFFLQYFTLS